MTFQELLYFYAVMSCPSDNASTETKRKLVKKQFNNILRNINNASDTKIYAQSLPSTDSAIKEFLGFSNQNDIERIKKIVTEIMNDAKVIINAIKIHTEQDDNNAINYTEYLDNQLQEEYPQLSKYSQALIQWQAEVIQNGAAQKPKPPVLMFPHTETQTRLNLQTTSSNPTERQRLLNTEEQNQRKLSCTIS